MKVNELIAKLQQLNQDIDVVWNDGEDNWDIEGVDEIDGDVVLS